MVSIGTDWKKVYTSTRNNCERRIYARVSSQSAVDNYSIVQVYFEVSCPSGYGYSTSSWSATLTGCNGTSGGYTDYEARTVRYIPTSGYGSIKVNHNDNGDGSTTIKGTYTAGNSNWNLNTGDITLDLPHINRIGVISSVSASSLAGSMSVDYSISNTSFYHRLRVSVPNVKRLFYIEDYLSGSSFSLSDYTTDSVNSLEWVKRNVINSKTVKIEYVIETWTAKSACTDGGTPNVGTNTSAKELSIGGSPVIGSFTVTEENISDEITVKDMSQKALSVTCSTVDYATIKSVVVSSGGSTATLTKTGTAYTGHLVGMTSNSNRIDYVLTVTDSRGWTKTDIITQDYYEYSAPSVEACEITRVPNPSGTDPTTPNTEDALGHVTFRVHFTPILGNTVRVTATGIGSKSVTSGTSGTFDSYIDLDNADYRESFAVTVTFIDSLGGRASVNLSLPKAIPTMIEYEDEIDMNVPLWIEGNGVPTIITNENGKAYKFPNGLLICEGTIKYTGAISNAWGSDYWGMSPKGTFAHPFANNPPKVYPATSPDSWGIFWAEPYEYGEPTLTETDNYYLIRAKQETSTQTYYIDYLAIGQWK